MRRRPSERAARRAPSAARASFVISAMVTGPPSSLLPMPRWSKNEAMNASERIDLRAPAFLSDAAPLDEENRRTFLVLASSPDSRVPPATS